MKECNNCEHEKYMSEMSFRRRLALTLSMIALCITMAAVFIIAVKGW